ncbi:LuxR C-terminal-related transcriptional regulator [Terrabacter sp. NPDC080008]|uniref:LuxR C-terminal-related transcriptional regulator n=1 Tax=Terrabacter sp. NPDC080008 TaxID=3155176 RepID=UPI00344EBDB1
MPLSDAAVRALRHADQAIHEADRSDVFTVYDACRAAVGSIAPVDDFYVALVRVRDRQISYPYVFSNGRHVEAGTMSYGPSGLVAWVLASRKPYRYADDQGALLNRGMRFGDEDLSADAVVVPMATDDGVVGLIGALSDTPDSLGDEVVTALTWLAGLVQDRILAMSPVRRLNLAMVYPELEDSGRAGTLMAVNQASSALTQLAADLDDLQRVLAESGCADSVLERLESFGRRCFEVQAAIVTRLGMRPEHGGPGHDAADPLEGLSPRERAVVALVTGPEGDPGNAGIAEALDISTATVKTHMASVLAKLGLTHRSELRWLVRGYGGHGDHEGHEGYEAGGSQRR